MKKNNVSHESHNWRIPSAIHSVINVIFNSRLLLVLSVVVTVEVVASGAKIGNHKRLTWFCLWDNKSKWQQTLHRSLVWLGGKTAKYHNGSLYWALSVKRVKPLFSLLIQFMCLSWGKIDNQIHTQLLNCIWFVIHKLLKVHFFTSSMVQILKKQYQEIIPFWTRLHFTRMARMLTDLRWILEVVLEGLSLEHCYVRKALLLSIHPKLQ